MNLEWYEVAMAAQVGVGRNVESLAKDHHPKAGQNRDDLWRSNIEGACGEMAAAKAMNLYWAGSINTFNKEGDIGRLQVRTTRHEEGELIICHGDKDGDIFILVTGVAPTFIVRGWISGQAGKNPEFEEARGGRPKAFFVPHKCLQPIETLRSCIHASLVNHDV